MEAAIQQRYLIIRDLEGYCDLSDSSGEEHLFFHTSMLRAKIGSLKSLIRHYFFF